MEKLRFEGRTPQWIINWVDEKLNTSQQYALIVQKGKSHLGLHQKKGMQQVKGGKSSTLLC